MRKVDLVEQRSLMQKAVLNYRKSASSIFFSNADELKFLKQYKEFLSAQLGKYPEYLFGEYDEDLFKRCYDIHYQGSSLLKAEQIYRFGLREKSDLEQMDDYYFTP